MNTWSNERLKWSFNLSINSNLIRCRGLNSIQEMSWCIINYQKALASCYFHFHWYVLILLVWKVVVLTSRVGTLWLHICILHSFSIVFSNVFNKFFFHFVSFLYKKCNQIIFMISVKRLTYQVYYFSSFTN